jgi:hypothetical protein
VVRLSWESLSEIEFGILMVTRANFTAPWIMFEGGALSKTVKSRVIPILCDVERLDIGNTPLAQFQNALVTKEDIWQVVVSVNSVRERAMDESRLRVTFEKWWPDFHTQFSVIKFPDHGSPAKTSSPKADAARFDKIEGALEAIMSGLQRVRSDIAATTRPTRVPGQILTMKSGNQYIRDEHGKLRALRVTKPPDQEPPPGTDEDDPAAPQSN